MAFSPYAKLIKHYSIERTDEGESEPAEIRF